MLVDFVASKLSLPDLSGIQINYISDSDTDVANFLKYCIPFKLQIFVINYHINNYAGVKSKFYVDSLTKVAAKTAKEVYLKCIDFSAEDLQTVIKAARNTERIVFCSCCIHCSSGFDFGADLKYKTKFLSFQWCGSTIIEERTTDWKTDPSLFSHIVDAISNSGLRTSLKKVSIAYNHTLDKYKIQEQFNAQGMSHISVVEENLLPLEPL